MPTERRPSIRGKKKAFERVSATPSDAAFDSAPGDTPSAAAFAAPPVAGQVPSSTGAPLDHLDHLVPSDTFDLGEHEDSHAEKQHRKLSWARQRGKAVKRARAALRTAQNQDQAEGELASAGQAAVAGPVPVPAHPDASAPASEPHRNTEAKTETQPHGADSTSRNAADVRRAAAARSNATRKRAWERWGRKALAGTVGVVLAVVLACGGYYLWDRYLRYDDAIDMQGEWRTADGAMSVVIDADSINMPDGLEYAYTIDTARKTIAFSFAELTGGGSYEFSKDRQTLSINEGSEESPLATVLVRVSDNAEAVPQMLSGEPAPEPDFAAEGEPAVEPDPGAAPAEGEPAPQEEAWMQDEPQDEFGA